MKLTGRAIAALALPSGKGDAIHFDDTLIGFGYRLRRSGDKVLRSFVVQYRRHGASRRVTIGSADVLGVDQARAHAQKLLAALPLGEDPAAHRPKDRVTFAVPVPQQLTDH